MELLEGVFDFARHKGSGPLTQTHTYEFARAVRQASAVLSGYTAEFAEGDHEFRRLTVELNIQIFNGASGGEVMVTGTFGLRDNSGVWNDYYQGQVRFCLLAELVDLRPPIRFAARQAKGVSGKRGAGKSAGPRARGSKGLARGRR